MEHDISAHPGTLPVTQMRSLLSEANASISFMWDPQSSKCFSTIVFGVTRRTEGFVVMFKNEDRLVEQCS
eukprot:6092266-Amphidinium_carterae.4